MRPHKKSSPPVAKDGLSDKQRQSLEEEAKWEARKRLQPGSKVTMLILKVLVTTIDALGHFQMGQLQHSGRGWGM